jgi:phosphoribosylformylglycinamidine (FGAM) synthase PurS component
MKLTMFVKLVVPDNVAITAKRTLKSMGFTIENLERFDYYELETTEDIKKKLEKIDILANANKHKVTFSIPDNINILTTNRDDNNNTLLETLRERLNIKQITSIKKGILWTFHGCNKEEAEDMTKQLLINEHYQDYKVL